MSCNYFCDKNPYYFMRQVPESCFSPVLNPDQLLNRFWCRAVMFTLAAHYTPKSRVRASGTYAVAPYGRMLCAMLASWHYPRVNGQTLVNRTYSSSWDPTAWVTMTTGGLCGCRVAMKRKEEGNGRAGGSQVNESNKSFRSQWSGEVNLGFDVQFVKKKVGMVSHWL